MVYRALSDAVVVVHLGFIVFVAVGGLLAWRWRWLVGVHVAAVAWGAAIIIIGFDCPLTPLEKGLRERGGEAAYEGGFVDRYVEDIVYPGEYTPYLRALAVLLIVAAYARMLWDAMRPRSPMERAHKVPARPPTEVHVGLGQVEGAGGLLAHGRSPRRRARSPGR